MTTTFGAAPLPQYLQVKQFLRDGLLSGRWAAGDLLPSEAALVAQFGVSRMTVNRALRELTQDGLLERIQGVGTFVAQLHKISSTLQVRDVREEIIERGHRYSARVRRIECIDADAAQAAAFGLDAGAPLFHSVIVHCEEEQAIQCEDRLVNPACAPDYLSLDFTRTTPTHHLLAVAPLSEVRYTIEAGLPSGDEAAWLGIGRDEPCLIVNRQTFSQERVVTTVRLIHPGSRYLLEGGFKV